LRKQLKKPERRVEGKLISRFIQHYETISVNEITRVSGFPFPIKPLQDLQKPPHHGINDHWVGFPR
jgi:hypothetical protein